MKGEVPNPEPLTEADLEAALRQIKGRMDALIQSESNNWPVAPRSQLALDDAATRPYLTSEAASSALGAAVDHLHALTSLIVDTRTIHSRAPFSLARAVIENASAAYWLLAPKWRPERVLRTMQWHAQDTRDGERAAPGLGTSPQIVVTERLAQLHAIAIKAGCDIGIGIPSVAATAMVKAAEAKLGREYNAGPLGAWRVFSGFAHARPWATSAFLDIKRRDVGDGMAEVVSRASLDRVVYAAAISHDVFALAARTYRHRAR